MERIINYEKNTVIPSVVDISYDMFMTYLIKAGISEEKIEAYFENNLSVLKESFWKRVGYLYVGSLLQSVKEISDVENKIQNDFSVEKDKSNFIIQELLCLTLGIWDKTEYNKEQITKREAIVADINEGISVFNSKNESADFYKMYTNAVVEYLKTGLSRKELVLIQELPVLHNVNGKNIVYPLTKDGEYTFGVVNPWPGAESAEAEVLSRMQVAADDIGLGYTMLDNFAHILEKDTQKATSEYVKPEDLEFVMTTHYESEKTVDTYYYHTLWNPPEIPLNLGDYDTRITNNYIMNDDFLIYDFGGMSNHLKGMLLNKPRTIEGASSLTASFPMSKMLEPKLEDPKLFYCGMNWEKVVSNSNRHEGLFKLLDETGDVKFFGPDKVEAWGGLRPWEGYKCYQYSIPFDGFSILDEINKCGVCLVLSSDIHRRAGAATNRTYEACAAGAVIISDDNEFMQHYFKDAALFIEYNKNNPKDTFEQIMEKYRWIVEHKEEALEMARKAQEVFRENFALDNQFLAIVNNHYDRFKVIEKDLFATNENGRVLVTYVVDTLDIEEAKEKCLKVIRNIKNQYYGNIVLGIACDIRIKEEIVAFVKMHLYSTQVVSMELFDHKKSKKYTDGQAIRILQNSIKHEYWANMFSHEVWFYDHITTLVRELEDNDVMCAYSGRQHKDTEGFSRVDSFDRIHLSSVFGMNWPDWIPVPGQLLFKAECHKQVPDFMVECLDGYEHYAYLAMNWVRNKAKIVFSRRMTCCWEATDVEKRGGVLKPEFQIRYLRDIMKFELPDGGLNGGGASREAMRQYMIEMPIKPWFKMRLYNSLVKYHAGSNSKRREKWQKKYEEEFAKFLSW